MRSTSLLVPCEGFGCLPGSIWKHGDRLGFAHLLGAVTEAFELMALKRLEHMAKVVGVGAVELRLIVQLEILARHPAGKYMSLWISISET